MAQQPHQHAGRTSLLPAPSARQAPLGRLLVGLGRARRPLGWLVLAALVAALALAPLPRAMLLAPLILALLLAPFDPIIGVCLAILSVPAQDLLQLPGGLSLTQAAMLLAVASAALGWLLRRPQPSAALPARMLLPWLGMLWALGLATAFTPFSTTDALKETFRWGEAFVIWLLALSAVRRPWHLAALLACLLLAPFAEALVGLGQFALGAGPPSFRIAAGLPFVRAYGTIGQPNSFAGYMNMAWPLALSLALGLSWQAWRREPQRPRAGLLLAGAWLLAATLLAALLASFSRGAWLGALAGLAGMALALGGRARWAALAVLALGALALLLGGGGLLPATLASRLASITSYLLPFDASAVTITPANFAVVERMAQIQAGWRMLIAHPLTGVGPGNYSNAYPFFAIGPWYVSRGHAHNYYVHIAAESGLTGLLAYLLLLGGVLRQARRTLRSVQATIKRSIAIGCCGIIAAVVGHNVFENLHVLSMGIQLAAVWALLGALEQPEQRPHNQSLQSTKNGS